MWLVAGERRPPNAAFQIVPATVSGADESHEPSPATGQPRNCKREHSLLFGNRPRQPRSERVRALDALYHRPTTKVGFMHAARWQSFWRSVGALIKGEQLWLTGIGRARAGDGRQKHSIKAVDRLLGNKQLRAADIQARAERGQARIWGSSLARPESLQATARAANADRCLRGRGLSGRCSPLTDRAWPSPAAERLGARLWGRRRARPFERGAFTRRRLCRPAVDVGAISCVDRARKNA